MMQNKRFLRWKMQLYGNKIPVLLARHRHLFLSSKSLRAFESKKRPTQFSDSKTRRRRKFEAENILENKKKYHSTILLASNFLRAFEHKKRPTQFSDSKTRRRREFEAENILENKKKVPLNSFFSFKVPKGF